MQRRSGVTSATLTGILDTLEQRGYLVRTPSLSDGRAKLVALTPLGSDLFAQLINVFHDFEQDLLRGFTQPERLLLTDWLERITRNLGYREAED